MELEDLAGEPLDQIRAWAEAARRAGDTMPDAMCLATASAEGVPSARMVLLRGIDHGLVFFTDYGSAKAADLRQNPQAAGVLHYFGPVHRQVRARGPVERTSAEESDRYWATRHPQSRRSALASHQSSVIDGRQELEQAASALADDPDPARPERWGGYRLVPDEIEFWEEGAYRLHDRIRFVHADGGWRTARLSP